METGFDLLLRRARAFTPAGEQDLDIGVRAGRIAQMGDLSRTSAAVEWDLKGLLVLPGVIDTQVHFREPGGEHKEDLESGTRAALQGGVTGVFEMPNTDPPTTTAERLADKLRRAAGRAHCDHAFYVGASPENIDELARLEQEPGCCGIKVFMGSSTGSLLIDRDETLLRVLQSGRRRVAVHSEDEARLKERQPIRDAAAGRVHAHAEWRDAETARRSTERLLRLARLARRRVHVLHCTTAAEMELLAGHKDLATVEVTPQHLTLSAPDCYDRLGAYAQMNPPIRSAEHQAALWHAVTQGLVDVVGSDHAPHSREEKDRGYPLTPSGMPGVQTLLPLLLNHMALGRLTLARLVDLTSAGPARIFQIANKGRLARGYDADMTIVDPEAERRIENRWIASRCGWTPFDGMTVRGWPVGTILRGAVVMREGEVQGPPQGKPMIFPETKPASAETATED